MAAHVFRMGDGFAIVCGRGRSVGVDPCSVCQQAIGDRLCDWPSPRGPGLCSAPLCASCAVSVDRMDYCPSHVSHRQASLL